MGEVFAQADALLVHLRDDPLFAITIPSKTQAYMAIGKPIVMGVRGDAARMLEEAGAGIVFEPERVAALVDAIRTMKEVSAADRRRMGEAGAHFYRKRLAFDIGVASIARELEAAAGLTDDSNV
jgi:glycosyltransferase involved in cell wall biosynthesis